MADIQPTATTPSQTADGASLSPFEMAPDYILTHISSYLSTKTLGNTTRVCKRLRQHALKDPTYQGVIKLIRIRQRKETAQQKAIERARKLRAAKEQRSNVLKRVLVTYVLGRTKEQLATLSLLLFTLFVTLRVNQTVNWSWILVFIPLLPVFHLIIFTPIAYDIVSSFNTRSFYFNQSYYFGSIFFGRSCFEFPTNMGGTEQMKWRAMIYTPIFALSLFFILLLLHLAGVSGVDPWLVMLPLVILSIFLTLAPVASTFDWIGTLVCSIGGIMLFIFFLLATLKLEGALQGTWPTVFIPLFIFTAITMLASVCISSDMYILAGYCVVLVPLFVFEILLVVYLEYSLEFAFVTIPLFFSEVLGVLVCYSYMARIRSESYQETCEI